MTIQEDVVELYYGLSPTDRSRLTWVLSKDTIEQIAAGLDLEAGTSGRLPDKDFDHDSATLMGRPIERDDTINGLSYTLEPTPWSRLLVYG